MKTNKKIGIYAKWLNSLGGGEKVATVMAEKLANEGYQVDFLSTFEVDKKLVERKMGVDLSKVKMIGWKERSYKVLTNRTKKYDLFINTSYLDHLPSAAKKSVYYVHFPSPIKRTILGFIKYETILPILRQYLIIPTVDRGLSHIDDVNDRGGKWLGRNNTVVISNTPERFVINLKIYLETLDMNNTDRVEISSANASLNVLDKHIDHRSNVVNYKLLMKLNTSNQSLVLKIKVLGNLINDPVALVSLTIRNPRYFSWNFIKRYLPEYEMALYGSSSYKPAEGLDTYDLFLSNSNFTKKWSQKYWKKKSKVLYPPVDVDQFKPLEKSNIIINVGRFFVGGHSKRQDILVKTFVKMVDKKLIDKSWELHLIGSIADGWEHAEFVRSINEIIKGYNIKLHHFIDFKDLKEFVGKAKIYWHATGYGESEKLNPIRFEHFGITVVEAMAAGCVPIVYRGGGLTETVTESSGFTWKTTDELVDLTRNVINDKKLINKISLSAQKRAKIFSRNRFSDELLQYLNPFL